MSITLCPNAKIPQHCETQYDDGRWDAGGADLLGSLHKYLELPYEPTYGMPEETFGCHPPWKINKETAKITAKTLSETPDAKILEVLDLHFGCRWSGSPSEFVQWIRDWQRFLETCEGYTSE